MVLCLFFSLSPSPSLSLFLSVGSLVALSFSLFGANSGYLSTISSSSFSSYLCLFLRNVHPPVFLFHHPLVGARSRHISLSSAAGSLTCLQHLLALADVKGRAYQ